MPIKSDYSLVTIELKKFLTNLPPDKVLVGGLIGSYKNHAKYMPFSDIDALVIFNNASPDNFSNSRNVMPIKEKLEKSLSTIPRASFQIVPTFRAEDIVRSCINDDVVIIHLLAYSSADAFVQIETPSIVHAICNTLELLTGNARIVEKIKNRPFPPFPQRISYLVNLLIESHFFMTRGALGNKIINESFSKLRYVLKYMLVEIMIEQGYEFMSVLDWDFLIREKRKIPIDSSIIDKIAKMNRNHLSLTKLDSLYKEAYLLIDNVLLWYNRRDR